MARVSNELFQCFKQHLYDERTKDLASTFTREMQQIADSTEIAHDYAVNYGALLFKELTEVKI